MISVIIPAHNEAAVIGRCLESLIGECRSGEIGVIVACNGCTDDTAEIVRQFGSLVQLVETDVPSKTNALNLAEAIAEGFPRVYVDADVLLSRESVLELARALTADTSDNVDAGQRGPTPLAVAPVVQTLFTPGTSWAVRAYYRFWMSLPYVQQGMMGAGVYAVGRTGRARFDRFPDIIADDGYVRMLFTNEERVEVKTAISRVVAPARIRDLVKIKTRSRLGYYQLQSRFPELTQREKVEKEYARSMLMILARPRLWPAALPYLWVNLVSRYRAWRQLKHLHHYVWEKDLSSRKCSDRLAQEEAAVTQ